MANIVGLSISYPDFHLNDIIDPDQHDLNNSQIVAKINEIKDVVNKLMSSITSGDSGADNISVTPIAPFASTKVQSFFNEIISRIQSSTSGTSGGEFMGTPTISGVTGATVASQLFSLKTLLDSLTASSYTKFQLDNGQLDTRYFTEAEINAQMATKADKSTTYTKAEMQGDGTALLHWNNLTNKPNFADARWGAPVATKAALDAMTGAFDGELHLVLADETVYEWDIEIAGTNKWSPIGAIGNGLTSHSALTNLTNDDHAQYLLTNGSRLLSGDMEFNKKQAKNLVTHTLPAAPATPVIGQLWYDSTNNRLNVYKGAVSGWVDVSGTGALIRDKAFTATAGQTVFDLSTIGTYEVGTNAISVFKNGVLLAESTYTETNNSTITLTTGSTAGDVIYIKWFENSATVVNNAVQKDGTLQTNLNADLLDGIDGSALVKKDGSVAMTGDLLLPSNTAQALGATTKQYVDAQIAIAKTYAP